jgi:hypothetical protein
VPLIIAVLMQGATRCITVRQLFSQDMQTHSHLCMYLQQRRPFYDTRSTYESLDPGLSILYYASWSVSCYARCVSPIYPILRRP